MMGYVTLIATCCVCKRPFGCNPHKVPSIRIDGERQPVCETCMNKANAVRVERGLPPHPIMPDAYEPLPEEML
jgi:hypothetical protein